MQKWSSVSPCPGLKKLGAARACTWAALKNLSNGAVVRVVVRAVSRLHVARLFSPRAWVGRNGEGDHVPHRVLCQPWSRRGDFQLPVLLALTWSSPRGACCRGSLGCRAGMAGWLGHQRLDLGLLLQSLQLLKSSSGSSRLSQAGSGCWLSDSLSRSGTGHGAQSP